MKAAGRGGNFLPGVKGIDDVRYDRQQSKAIQALSKLPRVSLENIVIASFRPWIARRLAELIGIDDEVLVSTVVHSLEDKSTLETGEVTLLLSPFMGRGNAERFVGELWKWIEKAQENDGVPKEFREEYERMMREDRAAEEDAKKRAFERRKFANVGSIRERGADDQRKRSALPVRHRSRRYFGRSRSPSRSRSRSRSRSQSGFRSKRFSKSSRYDPSLSPAKNASTIDKQHVPRHSPPRTQTKSPNNRGPPSPAPSSSSYSSDGSGNEDLDEQTRLLRNRALRLMRQD